ncbi:MAG: hypothetical protein RH859_13265 [Longimicrobiales bacterium]
MIIDGCERVRERLSEQAVPLDADEEAHLQACQDCAAEAELIRLLRGSRPEVPAELVGRIESALARERTSRGGRRPWWGLAAAAVAAVALGLGVPGGDRTGDVPAYAAEEATLELWPSDDGEIAGLPALDALSDDALAVLLDELGPSGPGGAA